jgi:hypothetical protein
MAGRARVQRFIVVFTAYVVVVVTNRAIEASIQAGKTLPPRRRTVNKFGVKQRPCGRAVALFGVVYLGFLILLLAIGN